MSEWRICKFCHKPVSWEELYEHMIIHHREKLLELFETQINEFLDDVVYENFVDLIKSQNDALET